MDQLDQQQWSTRLDTSVDDDPEKAARAHELAQATGADSGVVYDNLDYNERALKQNLSHAIVQTDPFIQRYINSHPLAAKVSNDDWGNLGKYTDALKNIVIGKDLMSIAGEGLAGFKEGYGEEDTFAPIHNLLGDSRLTNLLISVLRTNPAFYAPRIMQGLVFGAARAGAQFVEPGNEAARARLMRDFVIAPQVAIPELAGAVVPAELNALARVAAKGDHWVKAGKFPPPGDPDFDPVHKEQVKLDMDRIDEAYKALQGSSTLERARDLAAMLGRIVTDGRIEINASAVRKLYGGEPGTPIEATPDDGKLGWVPNLQEQLALAEKHNGDITVPISEWNARVDPELHKELRDFIRPREGGMTLEEAKEPALPQQETHPVTGTVEAAEAEARVLEENRLRMLRGEPQVSAPVSSMKIPRAVDPVEAIRNAAGLPHADWTTALAGPPGKSIIPEDKLLEPGMIPHFQGGFEPADATFRLGDVIDKLDLSELDPFSRRVSEFFGKYFKQTIGDVPVHVASRDAIVRLTGNPNARGFWRDGDDPSHIVLRDDLARGEGYEPHDQAKVVLHEATHALTAKAIDQYPGLRKLIREVMNQAGLGLGKEEFPGTGVSKRAIHDYAFKNEKEFMAEAIAKPALRNELQNIPITTSLARLLRLDQATGTMWDAVKGILKEVWGRLTGKTVPNSVMDAVLRLSDVIDDINKREAPKAGEAPALEAEVTPGSPTDIERRIRGLMPKGLLDSYMEKINKQQEEDAEFQRAQAQKRAAETQTKEWKQNEADMRGKVREEMRNRSDIAADRLFREGKLFDRKVGRVFLDEAKLTDEQKASLPKEYYGKGGEDPDLLARPFGYNSGDLLVGALARVKQERELEGLTPAAHLTQLVNAETERRMRKEYGTLDEAIAKEMQDHVISPTQIDLLHDKMYALGIAAKTNEPLESMANMKLAVKQLFDASPWVSHSVDKYLASSQRAYANIVKAFLKDDIYGAFKAQQEQVNAMLMANEAKKLEKENIRDQKLFDKYAQRSPTGRDPETANYIQDILMRTFGVMRDRADLLRQRELISTSENLRGFVEKVNGKGIYNQNPDAMPVGQEMPVAQFLLDDAYKKKPEEMSVEEKRAIASAVRTMDKYARDVNTEMVKGKREDLAEVLSGLIDRLKAAVGGKKLNLGPEQETNVFRLMGSYILTPETWFNRLDLGNARGPFNQIVLRPIVEGQYTLKTLEREYAKKWRDIGEAGDLRKKVDNPLFKDADGSLLELNKGNVLSILSNMGNELQRRKLAGGYGIKDPDLIWKWLFQLVDQGVLKQEDFLRAQRMGKFFEDIFQRSERMYSELSGVTPERIPLGSIKTPWGDMDEWYHPLIPSPTRHGTTLKAVDMMEESGYFRPAPAAGYTKPRTGAIYPIQLNFDAIPGKIKQMLNDIAMRPAITEVSKILLNNDFKTAFTQYYGKEYAKQLDPWLRTAAGQRLYDPGRLEGLETAARYLQENMATLLIGFNIFGTLPKHFFTALGFSMREVGAKRFLDSALHILGETDEGVTRWRYAMDTSEELQNRLRYARENISATNQDLFERHNWGAKFFKARDAMQTIGAMPVAMSDYLSAVIMWDAAFRKFGEENPGASVGDAIYDANRAVRRTHGSTIVTNRPAIMRNPYVNTFMPFYNFFNNAANRLYEFGTQAKMAAQGRSLPEMTGFEKEEFEKGFKHVPEVLGGLLVFGVMVSLIEQAVDPLPSDPQHPIKQGAKILTRGPLSTIPFVRDFVNASYGSGEPSAGIMGTVYRDIAKPLSKPEYILDPNKSLKMLNNFWGAATGLTYAPVGNVGTYIHSIMTGRETPQDPIDIIRGYRHGTQREMRR